MIYIVGAGAGDPELITVKGQRLLKALLPDCVVTIHVEPEHKAKHSGIVVLT